MGSPGRQPWRPRPHQPHGHQARRPPARVGQAGAAAGPGAPWGLGATAREGEASTGSASLVWRAWLGGDSVPWTHGRAEAALRRPRQPPHPHPTLGTGHTFPASCWEPQSRGPPGLAASRGRAGPGSPLHCACAGPSARCALPVQTGPAELSPLPPASLGRTRRCSEPPQPRRRTHTLGRVLGLCLPQDPPSLHAGDCRVPSPGAERTAPLPELALPGRGDFPWEGLCH